MKDSRFTSFQELAKFSKNKKIVFFGAGAYGEKTHRKIQNESLCIVDNNDNIWGDKQYGLEVKDPQILKKYAGKNEIYIIICTTSFQEVSDQLEAFGFKPHQEFIISPILNDLRIIAELESVKERMVFTSGVPAEDHPDFGGGIYELNLDGYDFDYRKIYSGNCHGLCRLDSTFLAVDQNRGLLEFDADYNIIREGKIPPGSRCHGISYSESTDKFYIVASYMDKVLVYSRDLELEDDMPVSHKYERYGKPMHHCNDICVFKDSAYVSMFSLTGNYSESEVYDGAVLEIDIKTKNIVGPIKQNLWMPHNVSHHAGNLVILESLRGTLLKNNLQVMGEFPGFTRGLAYNGHLFFVGQSRNRNFSKYMGASMNISIDTAIVIFDEQTKVSRSIKLPQQLSEVHSIILIENT